MSNERLGPGNATGPPRSVGGTARINPTKDLQDLSNLSRDQAAKMLRWEWLPGLLDHLQGRPTTKAMTLLQQNLEQFLSERGTDYRVTNNGALFMAMGTINIHDKQIVFAWMDPDADGIIQSRRFAHADPDQLKKLGEAIDSVPWQCFTLTDRNDSA